MKAQHDMVSPLKAKTEPLSEKNQLIIDISEQYSRVLV